MTDSATPASQEIDPRCTCPADSCNAACPVHGNHPSSIVQEIEDGDYHQYIWDHDDE